jgi:hypothetical protein
MVHLALAVFLRLLDMPCGDGRQELFFFSPDANPVPLHATKALGGEEV